MRNGKSFELLLTAQQIQERTAEICLEITNEYKHKNPIFIGILNGAFVWASDVVRQVGFLDLEIEFTKVLPPAKHYFCCSMSPRESIASKCPPTPATLSNALPHGSFRTKTSRRAWS